VHLTTGEGEERRLSIELGLLRMETTRDGEELLALCGGCCSRGTATSMSIRSSPIGRPP
jgi:hypothetical protein